VQALFNLEINEKKYPVEKAKGNAKKYNETGRRDGRDIPWGGE
jgi:hypothetical protein